ncbi:hypothetical protein MMA231_03737 (plasmid) [Asticcacaulis sp. MM231]|uniref:MbnP family copper-binding protein n=1 Tax=Asticcacaulis sp. MM231 TaxID=3157666 RepID=UPI0032D57CF0
MRKQLATLLSATVCLLAPHALAKPKTVDINFAAAVNGQPLHCGTAYDNVGSTGATLKLQDFRIFVSALRWIDDQGREVPAKLVADGVWQDNKVALIDFEDGTGNCNGNSALHTKVTLEAPKANYKGLVFEVGVPFDINHQDPTLAPAPLNVPATAWPWRIGFKFTTIDLATSPAPGKTATASGFSIHLGSTGCGAGAITTAPTVACSNPNRPEYRLSSFEARTHVVVFDLGDLLAQTDITANAPQSAPGCMAFEDDDDCIAIMDRFGLPFRGKPSAGQHFVSVR